jgi:hypothetical protein
MVDELNKEAFELINLVVSKPKEIPKERTELVGSSKERGFNDWSDKLVGAMVERTTNHSGKTTEIYLIDENGSYGFDKEQYARFNQLIQNLHSTEQLNQKVSSKFIEAECFNWIIVVYKNQQADSNLCDYLITKADAEVKPHTFYFPVLNLEIEQSFKIGNAEFTYFTKEYFDNLYETLKAKDDTYTEENFQQIFRKDFQGQVLAKVTVTAERDKAEEIAKQDSEIAVDVLKLYSESAIVPERKTMFDLNYKLGYQVQSNFLTQKPNESDSLAISIQFNNQPLNITQKLYASAYQSGLKVFSDYISLRKQDELHEIIIQSIHLFGSAISNWDLHLRCVNLITILESIFLKADESNDMERRTKARLAKALTNKHQEKERLKTIFSNIYQVRHKMIHKAKRVEINSMELSEAQMNMVNLFLRLIELNTKFGFKDKTTLIEKLNEIKS